MCDIADRHAVEQHHSAYVNDTEYLKFRDALIQSLVKDLNFATQGPLRHSYEFALSRGRIVWPGCPPHFNIPVRVAKGRSETEVEGSFTGREAGVRPNWHTPMFQDVTDAIISGGKVLCTVESAVETARVTEAIISQLSHGC